MHRFSVARGGDYNFGKGSSRGHATRSPRLLGTAAVSACIDESDLKKQRPLALTLQDGADYEQIAENDRISLGLADIRSDRRLTGVTPRSCLHLRFGFPARGGGRNISRHATEHRIDFLAIFEADRAAHHHGPFGRQIGYTKAHFCQRHASRRSNFRIEALTVLFQVLQDFLHFQYSSSKLVT
jgi:hypothetical protein